MDRWPPELSTTLFVLHDTVPSLIYGALLMKTAL